MSLLNFVDHDIKDRPDYLMKTKRVNDDEYTEAGLQPLMLNIDDLRTNKEIANRESFRDYTEQEFDEARRLNRRAGQDGVGIGQLCNYAIGNHWNSRFDAQADLQKAFPMQNSGGSFAKIGVLEQIRKACQHIMIMGYQELMFPYRDFVRIIPNGSYKKKQRYRWYANTHVQKVPAGGSVAKEMELTQKPSFESNYERYAAAGKIDECWFDSGNDDFGQLGGIITKVMEDVARHPEQIFFNLLSDQLNDPSNTIEFSRDFFRGIKNYWKTCQQLDPDNPLNDDENCEYKVYNSVPRPILLLNDCDDDEADDILRGEVEVCGGNPGPCKVLHLANTLNDKMGVVYTPRVPRCKGVILPLATPTIHGFTMEIRGTQETPQFEIFPMSCEDYGIPFRFTFYHGLRKMEEGPSKRARWCKNFSDVKAWMAEQPAGKSQLDAVNE